VVDVYGQWQGKEEKTPERIRSKMLVIDYPRTAENDAKIEAIRAAWKQEDRRPVRAEGDAASRCFDFVLRKRCQ
jgi:hypothetical protein